MSNDLISREAVKEELKRYFTNGTALYQILTLIDNAPTVETEITEEQAIDKLHETGWLQEHDKQMTERPHIIDNCDMNLFEPEKYMRGEKADENS